ncbi:unnamed protein product [Cunninghamella blakesleeana]
MANNPAAAAAILQQMPTIIQQYQRAVEMLTGNIAQLRQRMERTDISHEERERYRAQEQEMQQRVQTYRAMLTNLIPNHLQQQQQAAAFTATGTTATTATS